MRDNINFILRFRRYVATFLVLLFSAYYTNISLFTHYHVVDGATIVHSHFFTGDHAENPTNEKSHTAGELTLIQVLSNFVVEMQSLVVAVAAATSLVVICLYINIGRDLVFGGVSCASLRGPPAELSIG